MYSAEDDTGLTMPGFPIQKSPDQSLFSSSPKLIAAGHVFHRLLTPRHPPFALNSLATKYLTQTFFFNALLCLHLNCQRTKKRSSIQIKYSGGGERVRTDDLLRARQALSQLSYTPDFKSRLHQDCGGPGWS
jgi:hypothetical protein